MSNGSRHISLIRLHDFVEYPMLVLNSVAPHIDGFVFIISDATDIGLKRIAESHPQTIQVHTDNEPWRNGPSLDRCFRLLDRLRPETVLFTDHDEMLPVRFAECLDEWHKSGRPMAAFQYLFTWGDPETVVARRMKCWWHAKLIRWEEGIRFLPYRGCCLPANYGMRQACRVSYPLRHLCFTTKVMREKRLKCRRRRRHDRAWIEAETNPTIPYDPGMTFTDWVQVTETEGGPTARHRA